MFIRAWTQSVNSRAKVIKYRKSPLVASLPGTSATTDDDRFVQLLVTFDELSRTYFIDVNSFASVRIAVGSQIKGGVIIKLIPPRLSSDSQFCISSKTDIKHTMVRSVLI